MKSKYNILKELLNGTKCNCIPSLSSTNVSHIECPMCMDTGTFMGPVLLVEMLYKIYNDINYNPVDIFDYE